MTALVEWSGRLDRLCADLESQGFLIERDGLSVRVRTPLQIGLPDKDPGKPPKPPEAKP